MRSAFAILILALGLAACGDENELEQSQGVCDSLDTAGCKGDGRCQQAYENSGHQAMPNTLKCLLVESGPTSTSPCESLAFDTCRARNDCSPVYWQDLGPDDGPVGDPYYHSCATEASLN